MSTLDHDGVKLFYEDAGSGDPPMLFVHGWCCDHTYFAPQFEHFAANHRVAAIDQRGHGQSDAPEQAYTVEGFAEEVAWIIGELGLARPVVVGHSLGGMVAVALAGAHPDLVRALVAVDAGPIAISTETRAMIEGLSAQFAGEGGNAMRTGFLEGMFLATDDPDRKASIIAGMLAVPEHVAIPAITSVLSWDGAPSLARCTVPMLSIGAATPVNPAEELRRHKPDIVIGQTVGAGHFNQLEVSDQVNAMIEAFLRTSVQ